MFHFSDSVSGLDRPQTKEGGDNENIHEPVMVSEIVEFLIGSVPGEPKKVIDATLGLGGHTKEFLKNGARVLGIEADLSSLKIAEDILKKACPPPDQDRVWGSYRLIHGNFKDIGVIARSAGFDQVDGILFDLGISSLQLTAKNRGLSFQKKDAFLDMRLSRERQGVTAADLLNGLRADHLTLLFEAVLLKGKARKLTQEIEALRSKERIKTVGQFVGLIEKAFGPKSGKLNNATLPFLALRIAVNMELENIKEALPGAFDLLGKEGRLAVISFHSGEDEIVKNFFNYLEKDGRVRILMEKPAVPTLLEIRKNKRARSAKLRVIQKI